MNNKGYQWYTEENWQGFLAHISKEYQIPYPGLFMPNEQKQQQCKGNR